MGIVDFIKKQFLDIIQWEDDSQDVILYKFPMQDNEIQNNAKLIVRPGQCAIFVDQGKVADVFIEAGTYTLNTKNLPLLADIKGWAYLFESPFKSDVYFVNTKQFIDQKWGTPAPILIPDPKFEQVEIKAFGTFAFQISDPKKFLTEVTSTNRKYTVEEIKEQLKSFIVSNFAPIIAQQKITAVELASNYNIIDSSVEEAVKKEFGQLGLELTMFNIMNISLQEEYQEMLRKRSGVNIMGGMQNYAQVETLDAMKESVKNPGANGMAQAGIGVGVGVGLGGMMAQNMQGAFQNQGIPQNSQPAPQVDGTAIIECTNCKAKIPANSSFCNKCGTKVEVQELKFCNNCGTELVAGSKFCSKCGNKLA